MLAQAEVGVGPAGGYGPCRCKCVQMLVPSTALKGFNSLVVPVLSYGVQIWGAEVLWQVFQRKEDRDGRYGWFAAALKDPMVKLQTSFLRWLAGISTCSDQALYAEFGQAPLHVAWAEQVFRWWNVLVDAQGTMYHDTFVANLRMALAPGARRCWASMVLRLLDCLGYDIFSRVGAFFFCGKVYR